MVTPSARDAPSLSGLRRGGGTLAIAHRGASAEAPENSFSALDEALRQGCDHIEIDLQMTRDRVPVLFHDRSLVRFGRPDRRIAQLDLAEIRELVLGPAFGFGGGFGQEGIPTLRETLARYGRRAFLLLEVKLREGVAGRERHEDLLRRTLHEIAAADLDEHVAVLSFDADLIELCAREAPHIPRVLNVRPGLFPGEALRRRLSRLSALSARIGTLTAGYGRTVAAEGCPLLAFVCNTPGSLRRAAAAGARGVMSDRPGWLLSRLRSGRQAG